MPEHLANRCYPSPLFIGGVLIHNPDYGPQRPVAATAALGRVVGEVNARGGWGVLIDDDDTRGGSFARR
jgi:hypothetical protein